MKEFYRYTLVLFCVLSFVVEAEERPQAPNFVLSATADGRNGLDVNASRVSNASDLGGGTIIAIDITSIESWDLLDDPDNTIILEDLGPDMVMTGVGWDVAITTVGASWLSEPTIYFDGEDLDGFGVFLFPGLGNDGPGSATFSSFGGVGGEDGIVDLTDNGFDDVPIGADGQLYMQFYDRFDDFNDAVDATWDDGAGGGPSTIFIRVQGRPLLTIPTEIPAVSGTTVDVPVELNINGNDLASIAFSVDYDETCLSFDPTDGNADGLPDAINIELPETFSSIVFTDLSDTDGELDFALFVNDPQTTTFVDGTLATVTFTATCSSGPLDSVIAPVVFSVDPEPSFGDSDAVVVLGSSVDGSVEIFTGLRGDCNADGVVNAPDITACQLESFDDDGNFWGDTLDVIPFAGSPVGCDANADTLVDAGDISCKARLIFGLSCAASPAVPSESPRLSLPGVLPTSSDEVVVGVSLEPGELAINSLMFSLDYDETRLVYDNLPGAVRFLGNLALIESVTFDANDTDGELDIVISGLDTAQGFSGGLVFEVSLRLLEPGSDSIEEGVTFSVEPLASFGDVEGRSVRGRAEVETGAQTIFSDGFESGDLSAWGAVVP